MLVLTRRPNEFVMIGHQIVVKLIGIKGNQIRLGIEAPKEVTVHREEVADRIKFEESHKGSVAPAVQVRVKHRKRAERC
jgi:carbon storage regulator